MPGFDDRTKAIVNEVRTGIGSWKRADVDEIGLTAVRSSNEAECPVSWHASWTASLPDKEPGFPSTTLRQHSSQL